MSRREPDPVNDRPIPPDRKPYRKPRLTDYGDLRTITKVKGDNRGDGGAAPATKR